MSLKQNKGTLYLIPTTLGTSAYERVFPEFNRKIILGLKNFIIEDIRSARRFLKSVKYPGNFDDVIFQDLNKHTAEEDTFTYLQPLANFQDIGLMSEAGVPCLADPGNIIVKQAHELGYKVVPLIGPSSILLALIASGFNGQNFSFVGYLPVKPFDRNRKIKELESIARKTGQTSIFIETPYRNTQLFNAITENCHPDTMLCIAADITLETEFIASKNITKWKKSPPDIRKRPTVFLISV
jgi:16S rRNA (cytidine1402-2'-O)-methyltransferase